MLFSFLSAANEALKAAKKSGKLNLFSDFFSLLFHNLGADAYEATLEYGADGLKKARKLRR